MYHEVRTKNCNFEALSHNGDSRVIQLLGNE